MIYAKMTRGDVANRLGERPCTDDFKQANDSLPDWANTAYSPSQMASHGVEHSSIMWMWLRPQALGRQGVVRAMCLMAREILPRFESRFPDDDRPRKTIEAAERWGSDPAAEADAAEAALSEIAALAEGAADAAWLAAVPAAALAARVAAEAAWAAETAETAPLMADAILADAILADAAAEGVAEAQAAARHIEILEEVIRAEIAGRKG